MGGVKCADILHSGIHPIHHRGADHSICELQRHNDPMLGHLCVCVFLSCLPPQGSIYKHAAPTAHARHPCFETDTWRLTLIGG